MSTRTDNLLNLEVICQKVVPTLAPGTTQEFHGALIVCI